VSAWYTVKELRDREGLPEPDHDYVTIRKTGWYRLGELRGPRFNRWGVILWADKGGVQITLGYLVLGVLSHNVMPESFTEKYRRRPNWHWAHVGSWCFRVGWNRNRWGTL